MLLPYSWTGISHVCSSLEHWSLTMLRERQHKAMEVWNLCAQTSPEIHRCQKIQFSGVPRKHLDNVR